jgi:hypothetical protein
MTKCSDHASPTTGGEHSFSEPPQLLRARWRRRLYDPATHAPLKPSIPRRSSAWRRLLGSPSNLSRMAGAGPLVQSS